MPAEIRISTAADKTNYKDQKGKNKDPFLEETNWPKGPQLEFLNRNMNLGTVGSLWAQMQKPSNDPAATHGF